MNEMTKVFEGNNVRMMEDQEQVWFILSDVCNVLGLSNATVAASRLDEDEVTKFNLGSQRGEILMVNEFGLYNLVMGSRKKEAKAFKRWVTHEVLPSIRQTGGYQLLQELPLAELFRSTAQLLESQKNTHQEVQELKDKVDNQMTLDYAQQQALLNQKNIRVEQLWERVDFTHTIYDTKKKVHARAWRDLKNAFGASSYKDIRKKDFEEAMAFIKHWRPAMIGGVAS